MPAPILNHINDTVQSTIDAVESGDATPDLQPPSNEDWPMASATTTNITLGAKNSWTSPNDTRQTIADKMKAVEEKTAEAKSPAQEQQQAARDKAAGAKRVAVDTKDGI